MSTEKWLERYDLFSRIPFGSLFEKGLSLGTGQCNVKMYNRHLRDMIISGRAKPSFVISHEITLDEAPQAYKKVCIFLEGIVMRSLKKS